MRQCYTYFSVSKTQAEIDAQKCTSTTTTPDPCPWTSAHWLHDTKRLCEDLKLDDKCVANGHGQVLKCPNPMFMCGDKTCGDNQDYCCETNCNSKGGKLACNGARVFVPTPPPTPGPILPPTNVAPTPAVEACPWLSPHGTPGKEEALCENGDYSWTCVDSTGTQRAKCPPSFPHMCTSKDGCGGGKDHCCEKENCNDKGGPRVCPTTTNQPSQPTNVVVKEVKFTVGVTVPDLATAQAMASSSEVKNGMEQAMATELSVAKDKVEATLTASPRRLAADWVATMARRLAPTLNCDYSVTVPENTATTIENKVKALPTANMTAALTKELNTIPSFSNISLSVASIGSPTVVTVTTTTILTTSTTTILTSKKFALADGAIWQSPCCSLALWLLVLGVQIVAAS